MDNSEFNLYNVDLQLREKYDNRLEIVPIIGDVKNKNIVDRVFRKENIDLVFHAAAYKHVPIMESNICELVKNNVFGTYNVAAASEKYGVEKFVLISTDKVVNPTSSMGFTKKIAEDLLSLFGKKTKFIVVRFGNVLGSKGSLIPLLEKQIENGGPLTITHPKMKRFFMTIPEATQLILQAVSIGENGEVLILNMGKPYLIKEIAERLVKLHGLEPGKDIKFRYIGIRPGEKLYEELWTKKEKLKKTTNKMISVLKLEKKNSKKIKHDVESLLLSAFNGDEKSVKKKFREMVPSYKESPMVKKSKKGYKRLKSYMPLWNQKGRKGP